MNDSDTLWGYDMINEYNQQGNIVWSLNTTSFINPSEYNYQFNETNTLNGVTSDDLVHSNSLVFDPYENVLYYNSRNVNTFYKI